MKTVYTFRMYITQGEIYYDKKSIPLKLVELQSNAYFELNQPNRGALLFKQILLIGYYN